MGGQGVHACDALDERFCEGAPVRRDAVRIRRPQSWAACDHQHHFTPVLARVGVLLDDRVRYGIGETGALRLREDRGDDALLALGGDRGDDRLLSARVIVVVRPWRYARGIRDVGDADVLGASFQRETKRGFAQSHPRGSLLALAQSALVHAHRFSVAGDVRAGKIACTH